MSRKKIISAALAAALIVCSFSSVSFAQNINENVVPAAWDGATKAQPVSEIAGVYKISTAEELAWFAEEVNNGNNTISAVLQNDIVLNEAGEPHQWAPIGTEETPFAGDFDGLGHKITGVYINSDSLGFAGLFGTIGADARVQYLEIDGADITSSKYGSVAGVIAGQSFGRIVNVSVTNSSVSGTDSVCAGGIAGQLYGNAVIEKSGFSGKISSSVIIGGIAGMISDNAVIKNSSADAEIISLSEAEYSVVGGIVGTAGMDTAETEKISIENCYSAGSIDVSNLSSVMAGGLAGAIASENVTVRTSYSVSSVKSKENPLYVGTLFGKSEVTSVSNCYCDKSVSNLPIIGDVMGELGQQPSVIIGANALSSETMKSEDFVKKITNSLTDVSIGSGFVFAENENNGYPVIDAMRYHAAPEVTYIATADQFNETAELINNNEHYNVDTFYREMNYALSARAELDFNGGESVTIGTKDYPFSGKFDFNSGCVKNIDNTSSAIPSLFGYIDGAELSRVKISSSKFGSETCDESSAVVFSAKNSTVKNAVVDADNTIKAEKHAAAVAVTAENSTLESNKNNAPVTADAGAGIVYTVENSKLLNNENSGAITADFAGGIVTDANSSDLQRNKNSGSIKGITVVGGIISSGKLSTITESENRGDVTGDYMVGGIAGNLQFETADADHPAKADENKEYSFIKNANNGNVVLTPGSHGLGRPAEAPVACAGGIAGNVSADQPVDLSYNYSVASVTSAGNAGGLFGRISAQAPARLRRSYVAGEINGNLKSGAVIGELFVDKNGGSLNMLRVFFNNELFKGESIIGAGSDNADIADSVYGLPTEKMKFRQHIAAPDVQFSELLSVIYAYNANETANDNYPVFNPSADISLDNDDEVDDSLNKDESDGYYMIKNIAQFRKFIEMSDKQGFNNASFKLMTDIDLGAEWDESGALTKGTEFTPICGGESTSSVIKFKGKFDGQGHTISGLYINTQNPFGGLFGTMIGAEIKNLTVNGYIKAGSSTGGIADSVENSVIENCTVNVSVYGKEDVGGIAGIIRSNSTLKDCTVNGSVNGDMAGGIAGTADGITASGLVNNADVTGTVKETGGIFGYSNNISITDTKNTGRVAGKTNTGGIIGNALNNISLNNVSNKGSVSASADYAGGIIGTFATASSGGDLAVSNVISGGNVTANSYAGGIIAQLRTFTGKVTIENSSVKSAVSVSENGVAGGIIAHNRVNRNSKDTLIKNTAVYAALKGGTCGAFVGNIQMFNDAPELYQIINSYFTGSGASILIGNDNEDNEHTLTDLYMISVNGRQLITENNTGKELSGTMILAGYDENGALSDVETFDLSVPAESSVVDIETKLENPTVFAWNSPEGMTPIGFAAAE